MTTIIQLNPPLPFYTPKGGALAHFLIDMGPENNVQWICFQDDTGECWTWQNSDVRATNNVTMHRTNVKKFNDEK